MPDLMPFDDALAHVIECARPSSTEMVALEEAEGRVLCADVRAAINVPQRPLSAMDGFAIRDDDVRVLPVMLPIARKLFPGDETARLESGTCVAVFTGSPVPPEATRVVPVERVRQEGSSIWLDARASGGRHIRPIASDVAQGTPILPAGAVVTPMMIVAAAGCDHATLPVVRRPKVAILSTGDELVAAGDAHRGTHLVPESVTPGLAAMIRRWGGEVVIRCHARDAAEELHSQMLRTLDVADLLLVIGGASIGERDFARRAAGKAGIDLRFAGVAMRPGKPLWFGRGVRGTVIGLPGNPAAALIASRLLVMPLIAGMAGHGPQAATQWRTAKLANACRTFLNVDFFARARHDGDRLFVLDAQESSGQAGLASATSIVRAPRNVSELAAGDMIEALMI